MWGPAPLNQPQHTAPPSTHIPRHVPLQQQLAGRQLVPNIHHPHRLHVRIQQRVLAGGRRQLRL